MKEERKNNGLIVGVEEGGIAWELGVAPGDILLSVNGQEVKDVFDYRYFIREEDLEVLIQKPDGEEWLLEIEKDEDEDLGLVFQRGLMDKAQSCRNHCVFCFIDQLPPGLRKTLYFKDDDSRLSFLQGNYVTLTNMREEDFERILFYHLSPINISVHATDGSLRQFIMKNPAAAGLPQYLDRLYEAGLEMNFQIVLCKGINDGVHLDRTIGDLIRYLPLGRSLSVVPAGLTRYRDKLFPLLPFTPEDARAVIAQTEKWRQTCLENHGTRFVYASDEFYIRAGLPLPPYEAYEDFPQLENGVGMLALFEREWRDVLSRMRFPEPHGAPPGKCTLVTGQLAYPHLKRFVEQMSEKWPGGLEAVAVENEFFGSEITVSGLLTGRDICKQLKGRDLGDFVLVPGNALRDHEKKGKPGANEIFLDDMTILELEKELGLPVMIAENGRELPEMILKGKNTCQNPSWPSWDGPT